LSRLIHIDSSFIVQFLCNQSIEIFVDSNIFLSMKILLGNYIETGSVVHSLNAVLKLVLMVILSCLILLLNKWVSLLCISLLLMLAFRIAKFKLKILLMTWRSLLPFALFILLINAFMVPGAGYRFGLINISNIGITKGLIFAVRLLLLVGLASLFTLTTNIMSIIESFSSIFPKKSKLHSWFSEFSMIMVIAIRFVPLLAQEAQQLMLTQKARGVIKTESLKDKVNALIPLVVPLVNRSLQRAEQLGMAMQLRGYVPGNPRTSLYENKWTSNDILVLLLSLVISTGLVWLNYTG
jgi:energy-coupling factor transport system permease protein